MIWIYFARFWAKLRLKRKIIFREKWIRSFRRRKRMKNGRIERERWAFLACLKGRVFFFYLMRNFNPYLTHEKAATRSRIRAMLTSRTTKQALKGRQNASAISHSRQPTRSTRQSQNVAMWMWIVVLHVFHQHLTRTHSSPKRNWAKSVNVLLRKMMKKCRKIIKGMSDFSSKFWWRPRVRNLSLTVIDKECNSCKLNSSCIRSGSHGNLNCLFSYQSYLKADLGQI